MFFISASIQFSACEESENKSSNCDTDIMVNQPENQYRVNAQVFGGIEGCGIVTVEKDGETITNAIVKLNGIELAFDETMGYASFLSNSSGDEIELEEDYLDIELLQKKGLVNQIEINISYENQISILKWIKKTL